MHESPDGSLNGSNLSWYPLDFSSRVLHSAIYSPSGSGSGHVVFNPKRVTLLSAVCVEEPFQFEFEIVASV